MKESQSPKTFQAMVVEEDSEGHFQRHIQTRLIDELPPGDILVKVHYSSLNYKDALSASGNKGVTRTYPHTPGIDAAGIVDESNDPRFRPGDRVIVTSYDLGMNTAGGLGQYIRVPADWVVPMPENLSPRESMMYGTAGLTAALAVHKLKMFGAKPDQGPVVVTGATGGVGSLSIMLLAREKFKVVAATGKMHEQKYLTELGAEAVIHRDEVSDQSGRPLLSAQWSGAIDTVGGTILSTLIRAAKQEGVIASCGNAASHKLDINVYPFILRGVNLVGIDSGNCRMKLRKKIWAKLADEWKLPKLNTMVSECSLLELDGEIEKMLNGQQTGRILVNLWR